MVNTPISKDALLQLITAKRAEPDISALPYKEQQDLCSIPIIHCSMR